MLHAVHGPDGNRIAEYLWDPVAQASTLVREYVWMDGIAVGVVEGGVLYFVRTDHIGRPVFATNGAGAKVWEASYLPFGGVHVASGTPLALRFPGQWFQSESGLHQNWMRDYDPTTGRYLQPDPLGLVDGASVYGYGLQSPGRYADPRGEYVQALFAAAFLAGVGSLALDFSLEFLFGDGCYSMNDALVAFALGAATGGGGFAATGIKRAGLEFSHSAPARWLRQSSFGRWLDRRSNPFRALNGNYVTSTFHAKTDYWRRVKGLAANRMYNPFLRHLFRTPAWTVGTVVGPIAPNCECEPRPEL